VSEKNEIQSIIPFGCQRPFHREANKQSCGACGLPVDQSLCFHLRPLRARGQIRNSVIIPVVANLLRPDDSTVDADLAAQFDARSYENLMPFPELYTPVAASSPCIRSVLQSLLQHCSTTPLQVVRSSSLGDGLQRSNSLHPTSTSPLQWYTSTVGPVPKQSQRRI